jgi:hypothetical protein
MEVFVARIRELLLHEEKRRSFSQQAKEKAREFAAPALAERMLSLYQELIAGGKA